MRPNGPESVIIQIKQSLRQSAALDTELATLATFEQNALLTVQRRWAGAKYMELVSFPSYFTEAQANATVAQLQQLPCVEQVVATSGYNLVFKSGDFARAYAPDAIIPDAARRGFDAERLFRPPLPSPAAAVLAPHVTNRIIVRWKDEFVWNGLQTGFFNTIAQLNVANGCTVLQEQTPVANMLIQVLEFNSSQATVAQMLTLYGASEFVDFAQPDYLYYENRTPNDPAYTSGGQWNLTKISAEAAWDKTIGSDTYKIAVADTGGNILHPDFITNNGGGHANFVANSPFVDDDNGHGSNVWAIIGAQGNNGLYMSGVTWDVGLMLLKVFSGSSTTTSSTIAAAMDYAGNNQAIAINLSLGAPPTNSIDPILLTAARNARAKNMLVVAAAGNDGVNSDDSNKLVSPASIPTENMLPVGATDQNDGWAYFASINRYSNYGIYRVELGAPGVGIRGLRQTVGPNDYSFYEGTSQAAPHVSGAVNLVKTLYPYENYLGLKDRILMGVDDRAELHSRFRTGGRLNANKMLAKRTLIRNLSTRGKVENGDRILIGGFTVGGSNVPDAIIKNDLKVVIRGIGPSLPVLNVPRLNNPKIRLNNAAGAPVAMNDDWTTLPYGDQVELANAGLTPSDSREAALVVNLISGAYTVFVESQDGQFGVGMFEIYEIELNTNETTRLLNVSTRCPVGYGDERAIAGTIIGDPSQANNASVPSRRLLVFGKGPSIPVSGAFIPSVVHPVLPALPVHYAAPVLANPFLELHDATHPIASNDNWRSIDGASTGLEDKLTESLFAPTNNNESAIWPTVRPGQYTAVLSDTTGAEGIGLVEFYEF